MEAIKINIEVGITPQLATLLSRITTAQASAGQQEAKEQPAENPAPKSEQEQPKTEVTDEQLRAAVKEAKDRTSVQAVRGLFKSFGIQASSECPKDKRANLLKGLENLLKTA